MGTHGCWLCPECRRCPGCGDCRCPVVSNAANRLFMTPLSEGQYATLLKEAYGYLVKARDFAVSYCPECNSCGEEGCEGPLDEAGHHPGCPLVDAVCRIEKALGETHE